MKTPTPTTGIDLDGLATEAENLDWTIDEYHSVTGPDGRTVELNGFASVMAGGERQRASRARTKLIVDVLKAFPATVSALRASQQVAKEQAETIGELVGALEGFNVKGAQIVSGTSETLTVRLPLEVIVRASAAVSRAHTRPSGGDAGGEQSQ
jgi:hypothetical protein